jgi:nicotinamide mononucleotide transporter
MITNIASMPLYYAKGFAPTSLYYFILLVLAIFGFQEWKKKANEKLDII